jgi:hypothetical protein
MSRGLSPVFEFPVLRIVDDVNPFLIFHELNRLSVDARIGHDIIPDSLKKRNGILADSPLFGEEYICFYFAAITIASDPTGTGIIEIE